MHLRYSVATRTIDSLYWKEEIGSPITRSLLRLSDVSVMARRPLDEAIRSGSRPLCR